MKTRQARGPGDPSPPASASEERTAVMPDATERTSPWSPPARTPAAADFDTAPTRLDLGPPTDFPEPPGIVRITLDPETGMLALPGQPNAVEGVFLEGTGPTDLTLPDPLDIAPPDEGWLKLPWPL